MELDVENNGNDNSLKVIQTAFSKTDKTILFPYIESTYLKKDDTKLHTKIKTQIITENKPSLNICNYKTINFTGDDIETCCLDTFERLKSYTNSDGGTLYLADDNTLQRVIQNDGAITHGMKLQIITGTNVASYVADVGKYLCLNSIVDIREDQRFPLGTAPYDGTVNSVLCLPAITSFGRLIAVFEFVRLHELDYTKNDVAFAQGMIKLVHRRNSKEI
ncbi:hypothetical protein O3M35_000066 [Rhynocoris fuscipes]|uniref:GAF domain-containing protein n=1 Tax=Rhynocoris fuscipes TaxID=488301 RepID=A0AAW1DNV9_9HEMI